MSSEPECDCTEQLLLSAATDSVCECVSRRERGRARSSSPCERVVLWSCCSHKAAAVILSCSRTQHVHTELGGVSERRLFQHGL